MSVIRSIGVFVLLAAVAAGAPAQPPPAPPAAPAKPVFEVQVTSVEAVHALVLPMKGSYLQHPEALGRLGSHLAGRAVIPSGPAFGRYFSDPSVGEANLVWEVGFPVAAGVTAEAPFEIRDVPAVLTAVHVYRGPIEQLGQAWGSLVAWVMTNGYQPSGPAMQVFKGDPMAGGELELRLPVQK
jgi:effector-binding domain-containing protein